MSAESDCGIPNLNFGALKSIQVSEFNTDTKRAEMTKRDEVSSCTLRE